MDKKTEATSTARSPSRACNRPAACSEWPTVTSAAFSCVHVEEVKRTGEEETVNVGEA